MTFDGISTSFFSLVEVAKDTFSNTEEYVIIFPSDASGHPLEWATLNKHEDDKDFNSAIKKLERLFLEKTNYTLPWWNNG